MRFWIRLMVFFTGACVLILEILGGYLLAPFFGTSLYVWSSLITSTLVFLSVGYWLGGRLADTCCKENTSKATYGMMGILISGALGCFLIPLLRESVFLWSFSYGVQKGSLVASSLLFFLPMISLGMVTPYSIRYLSQSVENTGKLAGSIFFFSTLGSVAGSLLVAHVLIPSYDASNIVFGIAFFLLFLAGILSFSKKLGKFPFLILSYFFYSLFLSGPSTEPLEIIEHKNASHFSRSVDVVWKPLAQKYSFYGKLQVYDRLEYLCSSSQTCRANPKNEEVSKTRWRTNNHSRLLLVNSQIQSGIDWKKKEEPESYPAGFQYTRFLFPEAKNVLCIGVAGGVLSKFLVESGLTVDSIEIDPELISLAHEHFELPKSEQLQIFIEDGRTYLQKTSKKYDLIFLDAFTNYTVPPHLCTVEFFRLVQQRLTERGCFAMNVTCLEDGEGQKTWTSVAMTMAAVFGKEKTKVYAYMGESRTEDGKIRKTGNFVYFAVQENFTPQPLAIKKDTFITVNTSPTQIRSKYYRALVASIQKLLQNPCDWKDEGYILTDLWNPIENWQLEANQLFRKGLIQNYLPKGWRF